MLAPFCSDYTAMHRQQQHSPLLSYTEPFLSSLLHHKWPNNHSIVYNASCYNKSCDPIFTQLTMRLTHNQLLLYILAVNIFSFVASALATPCSILKILSAHDCRNTGGLMYSPLHHTRIQHTVSLQLRTNSTYVQTMGKYSLL